ncbi:hypothetical protein CVT24_006623 [Panaeolus cyanescens]|uniref:Structural maintenance of chromosomes protein n=1 Tax=Panaeolus cyanescens TaxID=181874 RepID=A0A409YSC6_9AGAR|nr:hypothetical protein CVT24_006623 [Panaeolus cyanescens]
MYIKTLTIQGFKSYRDQTQIEPFSPRHNVVVGRNGSGKSNFFAAIRFVLSDAYTSMTREERQALLHEGVSVTTTLSAYVEIVFDNSDNRFPTGHDEVILRRTIGMKKDEYSLDKKSASKADVMSLLESAGFSKSNPYYIVPQGRITALTNAKDHERLALLKEVAGTKVYEQRRAESLRIMADTDSKREKINELLDYIETRLAELEEEKEELKEFQEKDKERRCLEYALYQRELEEVGEALVEIEDDRRADVHGANVRREQYNAREKEIQDLEKAIADARHSLETVAQTRRDSQHELTDFVRTRTELECIVEDLRAAKQNAGGGRDELEAELIKVESQVAEKEEQLAELLPEYEEQRSLEASEKKLLDSANARLSALFSKQGRASKFRTKHERDTYLRHEINSVSTYRKNQAQVLESTKEDLVRVAQDQIEIDRAITHVQDRLEEGRTKMKELAEKINALKEKQHELTESRKDHWREDTKLDSLVSRAADELRTAERSLASMMDKDTSQGLRAVDSIAERYNLPGVYGPLYRLFEVADPKFNTAVEQTAGNSLFHVVVDSDNTASKVLDVMIREKHGRVTFMPLNRLKPKNPPMPNSDDAEPLIDKLNFDPKFEPAFQQVFGKTCVCRDLTIAAAYVKSHGINTITLDGDKVDRKGALTGGYHDVRRSRVESIKAVKTWRAKYDSEKARSEEVKVAITKVEQEITKINGQITIATGQQNQIRDGRDRFVEENANLNNRKEKLNEMAVRLEREVEELETEITGLDTKVAGYEQEIRTPMTNSLTGAEEQQIVSLGKEVERRRKSMVELSKRKAELEGRKNMIEIELKERLRRRKEEIKFKLDAMEEREVDSSSTDDLESRMRELKALNQSIASLNKKIAGVEKEGEELTAEVQELRKKLEKIQGQQTEDSRAMSKQQKTAERYIAKRQMLLTRKDECNRSIRDLGVLPEEAFEKYVNEKLERLVKKLHVVNEGLKKFAHVNKKAFEQYTNFTKQRDQLLERREELDKSASSIEELVQVLDQRKDEAIERTFKQVASNFEEVFEKLVPAGRGRLIIQKRVDQDEDMDDDAEETQQSAVDNYTGVSIKVSFNSKVDEGLRIQQLSGGQKSLVALATVFAIQKCDPAPFYLFDEIDANLDAQYRTAVASMIQSLSSTAQFITTTFRPEMLVTADKFYGVLFNNQKVSSIRAIKREEAQEFVDQEAQAQ